MNDNVTPTPAEALARARRARAPRGHRITFTGGRGMWVVGCECGVVRTRSNMRNARIAARGHWTYIRELRDLGTARDLRIAP